MRTKPIHKVNAGKPSAHRFFAGPSGLHPDLFAVELEGSDAITGYLDDDQARELRDELTAFLGDDESFPVNKVLLIEKTMLHNENEKLRQRVASLEKDANDRIQVNPPDDRPSPFVDDMTVDEAKLTCAAMDAGVDRERVREMIERERLLTHLKEQQALQRAWEEHDHRLTLDPYVEQQNQIRTLIAVLDRLVR